MTVRVKKNGCIYEDSYERGIPTTELIDGLLPVVGKTKETGTTINFLPDDTIFEKTVFKASEIKSRLHETAYLNPELTIEFEDRRGEEIEKITYHEPEGIVGFIKDLNKSQETVHDVIYYKGHADGVDVCLDLKISRERIVRLVVKFMHLKIISGAFLKFYMKGI